ncbi:MAG: dTDP-glucose 4,6-dehydratase [Hyphococcus sp.]|nr:MAG: dTDP-glucose 4,6-dehydratase [Marinicaulis sp.]
MTKDADTQREKTSHRLNPTMAELIELRLSRRGFVGGVMAASTLAASGCASMAKSTTPKSSFQFDEILRGTDETHHVPEGYTADVLIRWGDALFEDSPEFDPLNQTAEKQLRQFGVNNDYIGFIPLDTSDGDEARGILCVNHEWSTTSMLFPGVAENYPDSVTREICEIELASMGGTLVEIVKRDGDWSVVIPSTYNRRITAGYTPMTVTGPAAGHDRLKTSDDPVGKTVAGTLYNCAGGVTPWGTYLMAEENIHGYFSGELPEGHREERNYKRFGVPGDWYPWGRHIDRFNISKEPNEPNRFGWIVEVDPMAPDTKPKKRTALGRCKHEGAESVVAKNGQVVLYSGDDERFEYVYKFVTASKFNPDNRDANMNLLDEGTLYAARFDADGTMEWLPLVYGSGPLTEENEFYSQADVVIEARHAAKLMGATEMDRPEDIEPDPTSGRVWVMLTNNNRRKEDDTNAANPRAENLHGHIIEIIETDGDFTSTKSRWEFLVKCGDPDDPAFGAVWNPMTSENGWFGSPDNCAVDPDGRLWVATDGNNRTGGADGIWAMETDGPLRGTGRAFFRGPEGCEICGPRFTPDSKTLFVSVQHPGDSRENSFENPLTRWPDFNDNMPARSAVLAIQRKDKGKVGS